MRRGLVTSRGLSKHDKLMASVIRFLITKCDASPLDIFTEKKLDSRGKITYIDLVWKDKNIECLANKGGLQYSKVDIFLSENKPIILAIPFDLDVKSVPSRIFSLVKGVLVFDIEKEELFKSFRNFDEYIGYMILGKHDKTVTINL